MTRGSLAMAGIAGWLVIGVGAITVAQSPSTGAAGSPGVTFHKDVLPILQKNCQNCHRPGQIAPMSLLTYAEARPWARAIKAKVAAREMPPWHADPQYGIEYATDRSLKATDIDTILKWSDGGAVEGDPKDAPPPVVWPEDGWVIQPDMVVRGPAFEVPARSASNVIEWTTIIVPGGFTKDTWVTSVEIKPSDLQVTHHMCIGFVPHRDDVQYYTPAWADKPRDEEGVEKRENQLPPVGGRGGNRDGGSGVGGPPPGPGGPSVPVGGPAQLAGVAGGGFLCYLPGNQVFDYRPFKAGALIPAGYDITFAQHYTPSGKKTVDFPQVGFTISDTPPQKRWVSGSAGMASRDFAIPPNDPDYPSPAGELEFGTDAELVMLMPHMHLRGKDMTYAVIYPDGRRLVALSVPKYDFNWQQQYVLKKLIPVTAGTRLHVQAHYNNSTSNKFNPNPNRWVYQGNMTWEEMMTPFMAVLVDTKVDPATIFRRGFVANDGGD